MLTRFVFIGAMMTQPTPVTQSELIAQYQQTDLQDQGISLDKALSNGAIRISLIGAAKAARRAEMRRALAAPSTHYKEAA